MKISISVPKPCHENWNAMTPAADPTTGIDGRHCDSCQHTVMDLTRVSDAQLIDLFRKDAMPKCARFSQGQLDRVIAMEERTPRLLATAAVGAALALASPDADAQSRPAPGCTPTLGKMAVTAPAPVVDFQTVGEFVVLDPAPVVKGEMGVVPVDTADRIIDGIQMGQPIIPLQVDVEAITITGDAAVVHVPEDGIRIRGGRAEVFYYIDGIPIPQSAIAEFPRRPEDVMACPIAPNGRPEVTPVITGGIPCDFADVIQQPIITITGRVLDETSAPFPFTSVRLRGGELSTVTDEAGRYALSVPINSLASGATLVINSIGYHEQEVAVPPFVQQTNENACVYDDKAPLTGRIVHADGVGAAGSTVELVEAGAFCVTDAHGYFSFDATAIADLRKITIAVRVAGEECTKTIGSDVLPCSLPFTLDSAAPAQVVSKEGVDLGDAVMETSELMILGEFASCEVRGASTLTRVAQPLRWIGRQIARPFR